ncbi:MAG: Rad52/Rad22 family DNA repair protein [Candidatus Thiodiazotropha sp.]
MITALLKRPFPKERVHFRAGATNAKRNNGKATKAIALAYIDARDVMDRLDEVVGNEHWQDSYSETSRGRVICTLKINFPGIGWIAKSDGAGDTGTEGEKGAISDAFKRAAVKFGIGRYLYSFPNEWYDYDGWKFVVSEFKFPKGATEKEWKLSQSHKIDKEVMQQSLIALVEAINEEDEARAKETMNELSEDEQGYVWRLLSTKQKEIARVLAKKAAA